MGRVVFEHGDKVAAVVRFPYTETGYRAIRRAEAETRRLAKRAKSKRSKRRVRRKAK